ncbi:hypothetical protein [Tsuneonella mangrovi]|uniref:hypothetical protein n=1 Tax=Tsuneonella mangrovi TaxID=1982042 RepID=UPI000BA250E6|nr:hypothetical protein [Tsuneonella mangrovi]
MASAAKPRAPWHLWVVGLLTLLFNFGGVADYVGTHAFPDTYLAQFDAETRAYFLGFPAWQVAFWAFGVWGSFVASILVLARSRYAFHSLLVGLLGLAVMTLVQYTSTMPASIDTPGVHIFNAVIWAVQLLLLWYIVRQSTAGVLR